MVLIQHGSDGENFHGEERDSEKQGSWGTGGEQDRGEIRRLVPRRWRGAPSARSAACVRVPRRCRRACALKTGRGVPE